MNGIKKELLRRVEFERGRLVEFLQAFIRINTSNPPGNTTKAVDFILKVLKKHEIDYQVIAPQADKPNIVASFGDSRRRHLILNGHLDVFPIGEPGLWQYEPLGAVQKNGYIYGRGAVDMKSGSTASLFTYLFLHPYRKLLNGRLTLTLVSDEETGGEWGSDYLVEHHPELVLGDCVLNAEPSSPETIRFAEKSILWITFKIKTPGGHAAYPHLSSNACKIAASLIRDLESLESLCPDPPEEVAQLLARPEVVSAVNRGMGNGADRIAQQLTVNIGILQGGIKVNMLPGDCHIEADMRIPVGLTQKDVLREVEKILSNYPEVQIELPQNRILDPNWCDPEHEMVGIIQDNVQEMKGFRPQPIVSLGGTDCRFWRMKGIPAYVYGPSPESMGRPDERVSINEFFHVFTTHLFSAFDYLRSPTDT